MGDLRGVSRFQGRILYQCLICLLLSTATAHTGKYGRRQLFTATLVPSNSSASTSTSPVAGLNISRSKLPPVAAPSLMIPPDPPQRNGSTKTSATAAQQAGVSADMPGAKRGAQAPLAPAPAPAGGPPVVAPSPPLNWGNNPFAAPAPGNAPFNPTPMFNTILITGVGIAAVLVCVIGCMVSMRFVRFGQLPTPAPASRRQRQDAADGTGGAKMEPSNEPMRRAVLVHNPDNDICCGVELTPTAGQPVDAPTPQEDAKASSGSANESGNREGRFHGDSLSEIELR